MGSDGGCLAGGRAPAWNAPLHVPGLRQRQRRPGLGLRRHCWRGQHRVVLPPRYMRLQRRRVGAWGGARRQQRRGGGPGCGDGSGATRACGGPLRDAGSAAVIRDEQHKVQQARAAPALINPQQLQPLSADFKQWFRGRGIGEQTLRRAGILMQQRYCAAEGRELPHIAFPYYRNGSIVNVKYRALPKHFTQVKGGEQIFYGYDDAKGADDIIIVEGEMDKLAVDEALLQLQQQDTQQQQQQQQQHADAADTVALTPDSHWLLNGRRVAVLSVPAGAPALTTKEAKFKYVHACADVLDSCERIILAGDSDGPGVLLADELARRIGREKCWRVSWPSGPKTAWHQALLLLLLLLALAVLPTTPCSRQVQPCQQSRRKALHARMRMRCL
ncbi:hypothetical protein COO60DRAFT_1059082 [Scenedesmus sp. NREL 46B-D3]|nr:hypothetical protein COO60DRAFT_1059082 [Scenedesmus sp. NREL 46B-D3]